MIEDTRSKGNINDYIVKVHGLKSSSKLIGANQISEKAERLETAGYEGNIDYINMHTGWLLNELKKLADNISLLF